MVLISSLPFILFLSSLLHGSHFLSTIHSLTVILNAWFSFPLYHSFSFCPPFCMVLIIFSLSFASSQKVSTNPQTLALSSCVLQNFPAAVFSIYVAQGPAFRREFLCQNNEETTLLPQSHEQIRRPIQTRR